MRSTMRTAAIGSIGLLAVLCPVASASASAGVAASNPYITCSVTIADDRDSASGHCSNGSGTDGQARLDIECSTTTGYY